MRTLLWTWLVIGLLTLAGCSADAPKSGPGAPAENVAATSEALSVVDTVAVNGNSCGGGICGNPTWTRPQSPSGGNGGNFTFTDAAPAGSTATTIQIQLFGVNCGSGIVSTSINGTSFGNATATDDGQ